MKFEKIMGAEQNYPIELVLEELEQIIEFIKSEPESDYNRGCLDAYRGAYLVMLIYSK